MKLAAILAWFVFGLPASMATAAHQPKRISVRGTISALSSKRLVVRARADVTCRVGGSLADIVRDFSVGEKTSITCVDGLLTAIIGSSVGQSGSASVSASSSSVSSSSSGSAAVSTSSSTSSATKSNSQSLSAAIGTITGLGGGSITVGPVSCQLGAGSPDTSGFSIGGRVSLVCVNGTVTGLAPAS